MYNVNIYTLMCAISAPANSDGHGLRRGGTGTNDLRLQAVGLEHVQEGVAGRH